MGKKLRKHEWAKYQECKWTLLFNVKKAKELSKSRERMQYTYVGV